MKIIQSVLMLALLAISSSGFCQTVTVIHPEEGDYIHSKDLVFSLTYEGLRLLQPDSEIELFTKVGKGDGYFYLGCDLCSGNIEVMTPKPNQLCKLSKRDPLLVVARFEDFPCPNGHTIIRGGLRVDGIEVDSHEIGIDCEDTGY